MKTKPEVIDYDHGRNTHSLAGPRHALSVVLARLSVRSLLDVGCGQGTWLKAATDCGVQEIAGIDGVPIQAHDLHFSPTDFHVRDLTQPLDLGRRFDLALCLEVGEHLPEGNAPQLISNLTRHSDIVLFSAACPGQPGQHHVNCQWPVYWQNWFNQRGYVCHDWPRWAIWEDDKIEVWYRQNMFIAEHNPVDAGKEGRISSVVHPDFLRGLQSSALRQERHNTLARIANGEMPLGWLLSAPAKGFCRKAMRYFHMTPRN